MLFRERGASIFHKEGVIDCSEYSECFTWGDGNFAATAMAYLMGFGNTGWD